MKNELVHLLLISNDNDLATNLKKANQYTEIEIRSFNPEKHGNIFNVGIEFEHRLNNGKYTCALLDVGGAVLLTDLMIDSLNDKKVPFIGFSSLETENQYLVTKGSIGSVNAMSLLSKDTTMHQNVMYQVKSILNDVLYRYS